MQKRVFITVKDEPDTLGRQNFEAIWFDTQIGRNRTDIGRKGQQFHGNLEEHRAHWLGQGYEIVTDKENMESYFFNAAILSLSEPIGWADFYYIIAQITDHRHPLFGNWYYVYAVENDTSTFCSVKEGVGGILFIQNRVNEEKLYQAIEYGYVTLIRGAKPKYADMYPEKVILY